MKIKFNAKAVTPIAVALVIYTIFSLLYFAPQLSGDRLVQGDTMQYRGMTQDIIETREATGEDPQWNGSMFGGMPAYLINVKYPSLLIKNWVGSVTKIVSEPAAFMIFAMVAMWLMLVMMGMNSYVAIVGGAMYGLSTYFLLIIGAGHITKMWALVYAPLMMGSIFVTFRGDIIWGGVLTALFTSLEIGANHPQITYYFLMAAGLFWLSEFHYAWWSKDRKQTLNRFAKRTAVVAFAGFVALLSNLSPLYYTALHSPDTIRGGSALVESKDGDKGLDLDYATAWSYGKSESINLLIPGFMGSDSASSFSSDGEVANMLKPYNATHLAAQLPTYWGDQPYTAGPTYIGAVVIMLAIIGFVLARGRDRWWVVAISLIMLVLAWGKNSMWLTELLFNYLPGYDKFRTVSTTLVILEWTMPLMAAFGLSKLFEMGNFDTDDNETFNNRKMGVKSTAWAAGIVGGFALLIASIGASLFDFGQQNSFVQLLDWGFPEQLSGELSQAMAAERFTIAATDALRSVIYIVLAAATIFSFLYGRISRMMMVAIVGVLAVADLTGVATRYLSYDDFHAPSQSRITMSNADRQIRNDSDEPGYRVLNLSVSPFNDSSTSYWHRSIGGYHGAKLSRYQDLIDNYLVNQDSAVLDMLNTRYLINPEQKVVKRPSALGAAWFVTDIVKSNTPREEIDMLRLINLSNTAVVDKAAEVGKIGSGGEIELIDYKPHHLTYKYSSRDGGVAIFSEIYYSKGWKLYVDGEEMPYFRANYLLRAANLPAGEHTVEWRFHSPNWGLVESITLIGSLIILLSLITLIIRYVKK